MKKTVKLTESDLMRIIENVLNEQPTGGKKSTLPDTRLNFNQIEENIIYEGCSVQKHHQNSLRVNCPKNNIFFNVQIYKSRTDLG